MTADRSLAVWAERVLETGWLAIAVAVPLAFNPWGFNGFELPKALLLRALVLLMGMGALIGVGERLSSSRPVSLRRGLIEHGLMEHTEGIYRRVASTPDE